ncbi:hypothetical protein DXG01_008607 [Tephrocybe rancida]|nr:hypothetical protein DXG01_008607 [Tephrocybe rancida]
MATVTPINVLNATIHLPFLAQSAMPKDPARLFLRPLEPVDTLEDDNTEASFHWFSVCMIFYGDRRLVNSPIDSILPWLFQEIHGLKLSSPSSVPLDSNVVVTWTVDSGDPPTFNLYITECGGNQFLGMTNEDVNTNSASHSLSFQLPPQARALGSFPDDTADTGTPLAGNPLTITSGQTTSSSKPTSATIAPANTSTFTTRAPLPTTSQGNTQDPTGPVTNPSTFVTTSGSTLAIDSPSSSSSDSTRTYISSGSETNTGLPLVSPAPSDTLPAQPTAPTSQGKKKAPIGAIVGGVIGGLAVLGILIGLLVIYLRQQRRPPPPPAIVPLAHDENYVQPSEKNSRLAQISSEKAAAQQQRDLLQTEVNRRRASIVGGPSVVSEISSGSESAEQQMEFLRRRILELEVQQRDLEDQLFGSRPPPGYST